MTAARPVDALQVEVDAFNDLVGDLGGEDWSRPTPAPGWTVRHQIAHLISVFGMAYQAAAAPEAFRSALRAMTGPFEDNVARGIAPLLGLSNAELIDRWEQGTAQTIAALRELPDDQLVPWLVNDIPAAVLTMAGTTETFAHGQDVRDSFGIGRIPTGHVRYICEFAYHTRVFGYLSRGLTPPQDLSLRFEVTGPDGQRWSIGEPGGDDVVTGPAWDLALLVTRRRHPDDLDLAGATPAARDWMAIAQAYRGPAGPGRGPGQFSAHQVA